VPNRLDCKKSHEEIEQQIEKREPKATVDHWIVDVEGGIMQHSSLTVKRNSRGEREWSLEWPERLIANT